MTSEKESSASKPSFDTRSMHACDEETAREVFTRLDRGKDGTINVREFIITIRKDSDVAAFFGLEGAIHQEDGTREKIEQIFQSINVDQTREIKWEEFKKFFVPDDSQPQYDEDVIGQWAAALQAEQEKTSQLSLLVTKLQETLQEEQREKQQLRAYCSELKQMLEE